MIGDCFEDRRVLGDRVKGSQCVLNSCYRDRVLKGSDSQSNPPAGIYKEERVLNISVSKL